jgi:hypothetical protein
MKKFHEGGEAAGKEIDERRLNRPPMEPSASSQVLLVVRLVSGLSQDAYL